MCESLRLFLLHVMSPQWFKTSVCFCVECPHDVYLNKKRKPSTLSPFEGDAENHPMGHWSTNAATLDPSDLAMAPFAYNRDHAFGRMQSYIFGCQSFGAIPSYQPVGEDTKNRVMHFENLSFSILVVGNI